MNELSIGGMGCDHCRKAVLQAVAAFALRNPQVDLDKGVLRWEKNPAQPDDMEAIKAAVRKAGYQA